MSSVMHLHTAEGGEEYGIFSSTKTKAKLSVVGGGGRREGGGDSLFGSTAGPTSSKAASDDLFPTLPPQTSATHTANHTPAQVFI